MIRNAVVLVGMLGLSAGLHGCHAYDCRESLQCADPPAEDAPDQEEPSCDPVAVGTGACAGVFVSSTLGDDGNPGTRDEPVRTLGQAIKLARDGSRRVYACAETFAEPVTVRAGVELWGGLDCTAGWSYVGDAMKTTIAPDSGVIPLRFVPGEGRAIVADVHAMAAHAIQPSGSSIAALVETGAVVEILRSDLVAGNGAAGALGRPGGDLPAAAGSAGAPGSAACSTTTVQGGQGAINSCAGTTSIGGLGGYGSSSQGGDGTAGSPAPTPNPQGFGRGGEGQTNASPCQFGSDGDNGVGGEHGRGASGPGRITESGWEGVPGEDGRDGRPGQGGGGGGGSRAGFAFCGASLGGASGGGGGAGGCGGVGGKGGGYGGGSIGVLSLGGDVTIRNSSITTGRGGDGGSGGLGQAGGVGGPFGEGGASVNASPAGCDGGNGGNGGNGGHGGGGLGGPSIGILYSFGLAPAQEGNVIRTDSPGKGGLGGGSNVPGSAGEDGIRSEILGFPP